MSDLSKTDPNSELREAIKSLQKFALKNTVESSTNYHSLKVQNKQLRSKDDSRHRRKQLLQSIETIKSYYPLIEHLQQGNQADKKLAEQAFAAIHAYNITVEKKHLKHSFKKFVFSLFNRLGISHNDHPSPATTIPLPAITKNESPEIPLTAESLLDSSISQKEAASQQEADAFCMKAITLIREYGFGLSSITDTQKKLRKTPLISKKVSDPSSSIVSFAQTVNLFPGEVIELQGSFHRKLQGKVHTGSIPIQNSFHVRSQSKQTGFPHPSQHCGWGLGEALLPAYPKQLHLLPELVALYEQKWQIAHRLLPEKDLNKKAKKNLQLKRQIFEKNPKKWLKEHRELALNLLGSSDIDCNKDQIKLIIDHYFKTLATADSPYDRLANTYERTAQICCQQPYHQFHKNWFSNADLQKEGFKAAEQLLKEEQQQVKEKFYPFSEPKQAAFITLLTQAIEPSARLLLLEELSEKANFIPPVLDNFAKKLRTAAVKQLTEFLDELKNPTPDLEQSIATTLKTDIQLFQGNPNGPNKKYFDITENISNYYLSL